MSLQALTTPVLRGNSLRVTYTLDLLDGTDVTSVSSISGVAVEAAGLEDDITITMAQVGSTNVWTGKFLPTWVATPATQKRQRWVIRVSGLVADEAFEDAGVVVVTNHR